MRRSPRPARLLPLLLLLASALAGPALSPAAAPAQTPSVTSPEAFFGHRMGEDRRLARWDRLVEYYLQLDRESDRLRVVEMGPTTMGHPFLALFISSPANLARLDELRRINARLSDPRGATEAELERLVAEGRVVLVQSMGLHSSEVASAQMAAELTYDLLTRTDEEVTRILDNVVAIMLPALNPDGEILVHDWYRRTVGTEHEGSGLPVLYHKYIGHDTNRDAFMANMVEARYAGQILFREWVPQAYIDHHQMGPWGARFYVPPYAEPIRPDADPLVWREMSWYGSHIAYKAEEAGIPGVINAAIYSGWGHFGYHWITPFHNTAGMLTESASARLATPLFLHPDQLQGGTRQLPAYEAQTTFPNPWQGGWWRVRDIVEQQKLSAVAALDIAARNRETVLRTAHLKARRQTERGAEGRPAAFVIPAEQHDPLTAGKLVERLLWQGVEVQQARSGFTHEGRLYGAGSHVVSMAQPKRGVVRYLLGRTFYPDNTYTRDRDGNPIRPYDMSADVLAEFMGVRVDPVETAVGAELVAIAALPPREPRVERGAGGYRLDGRLNDSFRAVNLLLERGVPVRRVTGAGAGEARAGDFAVAGGADAVAQEIARQTGVEFHPLPAQAAPLGEPLRRQRIGLFQRHYGGVIDEGWTRFLLDEWGFAHATVMDADLRRGNLRARYDVIVLPADRMETMVDGVSQAADWPAEYRSGFGREGVEALQAFVRAGGTLVTFAEAGELPIARFGLPVRNVVGNLPSTDFWSPGSTLRVRVDDTHPLGYGMPREALATFLLNNQAYEVLPTAHNERVERIVTFAERDVLQSGWLLGEDRIASRAAMVSVRHGDGRVVLIGFRPQHRSQTHGTFKLVFNALLGGADAARAADR
jgi:hypothetical protein